ncbi:unnamed protein product [Camellia sinensis]
MASLHFLKSTSSPFSLSHSNSSEFNFHLRCRKFLKFQSHRSSQISIYRRGLKLSSKLQEGDNQTNEEKEERQGCVGEEPPESLFMKELRRRGMTPTSLLEESNRSIYGDEEIKLKEEEGGYSKRNAVSTDYEKALSNQRERSIALNSEGLEGLIPRAKILLSIGGTFFLGFGPLILITVALFSALYLCFSIPALYCGKQAKTFSLMLKRKHLLNRKQGKPYILQHVYFGPTFVHDASKTSVTLPQYIDPYSLLEDERISQTAPGQDKLSSCSQIQGQKAEAPRRPKKSLKNGSNIAMIVVKITYAVLQTNRKRLLLKVPPNGMAMG